MLAYLDRIGVTGTAASDAAGLRALHLAHQLTVPFENLDIHLAEPISLEERDLIDKIVRRHRGGFCYELNGAFALLLEALGAQVSRVAARVYGQASLSPPFDHLALVGEPEPAGRIVLVLPGVQQQRIVAVTAEAHVSEPWPAVVGRAHDERQVVERRAQAGLPVYPRSDAAHLRAERF